MKLSREFLVSLKLNKEPQYRIAQEAGLHPNTLSKLINGIAPIYQDDPRILRVAEVLGMKREEVFND